MVLFIHLLFFEGHCWVIFSPWAVDKLLHKVAAHFLFLPVACKACSLSASLQTLLSSALYFCCYFFVFSWSVVIWLGKHSTTEQPLTCLFGCSLPTRFKMETWARCGSDLLPQRDTEILCMCLRCFSCHCHQIPDKRQHNGDLFCLQLRECSSSWQRRQEWFGLWCSLDLLSFFFFNFKDCHVITEFLPSTSSLWMPHTCTPSDSYANSWPLAFINCYYIQTHRQHFLIDTHTHIFLTTTCSSCTMLPVCMLLGLIIWYWTMSWFPSPRKTTSPAPNISQWALVLSVGLRTCGPSPSFGTSIGVLLFQLTFGSCVSETSWVPLLISLGESLTANSLILWLFQSFWPSNTMFLEL